MCLLQGPLPTCWPGLDAVAILRPTPPVLPLAAQVRQASNLAIGLRPAGQLQDGALSGEKVLSHPDGVQDSVPVGRGHLLWEPSSSREGGGKLSPAGLPLLSPARSSHQGWQMGLWDARMQGRPAASADKAPFSQPCFLPSCLLLRLPTLKSPPTCHLCCQALPTAPTPCRLEWRPRMLATSVPGGITRVPCAHRRCSLWVTMMVGTKKSPLQRLESGPDSNQARPGGGQGWPREAQGDGSVYPVLSCSCRFGCLAQPVATLRHYRDFLVAFFCGLPVFFVASAFLGCPALPALPFPTTACA